MPTTEDAQRALRLQLELLKLTELQPRCQRRGGRGSGAVQRPVRERLRRSGRGPARSGNPARTRLWATLLWRIYEFRLPAFAPRIVGLHEDHAVANRRMVPRPELRQLADVRVCLLYTSDAAD